MKKRLIIVVGIIVAVFIILALTLGLYYGLKDDDDNEKSSHSQQFVSVDIDCGKIEGKKTTATFLNGTKTTMFVFKGIPYASPPVGNLRWKPSVLMEKSNANCHNTTIKYNDDHIICKQPKAPYASDVPWKSSKEDCLVLNIRTTQLNTKKTLPVLVWIHGGGMLFGHSEEHDYHPNEDLTAELGVVSVTVNYRLNLFGFLSVKELWETGKSYGNYGITDLIAALKWIKNNIAKFGGNADDVTIMGQSGGGTGVYCLLSSGLARPYFHKVIVASGASTLGLDYKEADTLNRRFITKMNCSKATLQESQNCLRNLSGDDVLSVSDFVNVHTYHFDFPTNVENLELPLQVTEPIVVQRTPGLLTHPLSDGNKDVLVTYTAQEIGRSSVIRNFTQLRDELVPKIDSFEKGLYPSVLASYIKTTYSWLGKNATADYLWYTMTSDIRLSCSTSYVFQNLTNIPTLKMFHGVFLQDFEHKDTKLPKYAFHGMDMDLLFMDKPEYTENDEIYRRNTIRVYRDFLHSKPSFIDTYRNKQFIFWNNTIYKQDEMYHEKECEILDRYGFLKHSWGNVPSP